MPVWIVRMAVKSVWNAVAVAIATMPSRTLEVPAVVAFDPSRLDETIAATFAFPVTRGPVMTVAASAPKARNPNMPRTRGGHDFDARRRRSNIEIHIGRETWYGYHGKTHRRRNHRGQCCFTKIHRLLLE